MWNWTKRKVKAILIWAGIIGIATAAVLLPNQGVDQPITTIAEGQTIEFPYTDDNTDENFIIYTDQEEYHPLWAWLGFDVYTAIENKSGEDQEISFQAYFSKDFVVEKVYLLDESATSLIYEPIYRETCRDVATSTGGMFNECRNNKIGEEEIAVIGVWNEITQDEFSKEDYSSLVKDKDIKIKETVSDKAKGHFKKQSKNNEISFYKLRVKSNEAFIQAEFDLEVLGSEGGYGLNDPTIMTEDFNSYTNGDLNGQGSWSGSTLFDIQTATAGNPEGVGVGKEVYMGGGGTPGDDVVKTGSTVGTGKTSFYWRTGVTNKVVVTKFQDDLTVVWEVRFMDDGNMDISGNATEDIITSYSANTWYLVEVEWQASDDTVRARGDGGDWTNWLATKVATDGLNQIQMEQINTTNAYWDHFAEEPYSSAVAEAQMKVIFIQ